MKTLYVKLLILSSLIPFFIACGSSSSTASKITPIVIIGSSTVYINKEQKSALHYSDASPCDLYGWGELLPEFAKDSSQIFNYAQAGAGAGTFKDISYEEAEDNAKVLFGPNHDHYWAKTKEKMQTLQKGILLIQFGGNDSRYLNKKYPPRDENNITIDYNKNGQIDNNDNVKRWEIMYSEFQSNLKFYIDEARELNFIPVLITSPDKRIRDIDEKIGNHRGEYPNKLKEVAKKEGVRVLDLHTKTLIEYNKHTDEKLNELFCDCYNRWSNIRENTHFEKHGAKTLAGWIKELACEDINSELCKQMID